MRLSVALFLLLVVAPARAEDTPAGLPQMVDSPALKSAFAKASSGEVELAVDVAADGRIEHARVLRSTPPGVFDAAALDMVAHRRLRPAPAKDRHLTLKFQAEADPPASVEPPQ